MKNELLKLAICFGEIEKAKDLVIELLNKMKDENRIYIKDEEREHLIKRLKALPESVKQDY